MTEDEIRELLREMGNEPVPADSLRRVRLAVAERNGPRTNMWGWSAAVLAAAACVGLMIFWWQEPAPIQKPAPAVAREQIVPPVEPVSPPVRVQPRPPAVVRAIAPRVRPRVERTPAQGAD